MQRGFKAGKLRQRNKEFASEDWEAEPQEVVLGGLQEKAASSLHIARNGGLGQHTHHL